MNPLRLALAALLAALGLVAVTPATSYACSCAIATPRQFVEVADAIFTGALTSLEPPPGRPDGSISSADPTTYTFEVDRSFRAAAGPELEVKSEMSGASCGLDGMEVGVDYLVFAYWRGDELWAGLCGGTEPTDRAPVDRVAELTGNSVRGVVAEILAMLGLLVA